MVAPSPKLAEIIRVNQAGEAGAQQIYQGQIDALRRFHPQSPELPKIQHQLDEETEHLALFNALSAEHHVAPSVVNPLWRVVSYGMGYVTGVLGAQAIHGATIAVEEVIEQHYDSQLDDLQGAHPNVAQTIQSCRLDETAHMKEGLEAGGADHTLFPMLRCVVGGATRLAIAISKRV